MKNGLLIFTQAVNDRDDNLGFFATWIRKLAADGRPVWVAAWSVNPKTIFPPNVRVVAMPDGKIRRTLALLSLSWRIRREVSSVFVHMIAPVVVACGWFWKLLGWKITLWYTHGSVPWTLRVSGQLADAIVTATDDSMRLVTRKKIVLGHGIDLERFQSGDHAGLPLRKPLLLTVARISPRKDQMAFLALCDEVRRRYPNLPFRALIVGEPRMPGDDAYAAKLRTEIARRNLTNIVEMTGSKLGDDLLRLYSSAALFVSPSRTGSLDKVVLEALACGTPVLAVGESYRGLAGAAVLPSLAEDAAVELAARALREPRTDAEAREGVKRTANLDTLIGRLRTVL